MDNQKFEKKLEQIKTLNDVPVSIDDKIQKAYKQIEENERGKDMEKQNKFKLSKVLSLAASFVIVVFLAGNGIAYAKGEDNIYSWLLNKIGIQKEYEEIKTEINQTVESNGFKMTVLDIGYDDNMFIVGYKIEDINGKINSLNEEYKKTLSEEIQVAQKENNTGIWDDLFIDAYYKIHTKDSKEFEMHKDENSISLGETNINFPEFNIIRNSENEYILYEVYDLSKYNIDGEIRDIEIYIDSIKALGYNFSQTAGDNDNIIVTGQWNFNITNIETDYRKNKNYSMNINEEIDGTMKINKVKLIDGNMVDFIKVDTEIMNSNKNEYEAFNEIAKYRIAILDSNNNVVGEYPTITLAGEINKGYIRINNLDMNEKYKMQISVYDEKIEEDKIINNIELDCFIVDAS